MAYSARVLEVMIASPGDVIDERHAVREILTAWNVVHARNRKAMLVPIGWETHSAPELAGRPQQMINDRLLAHCDLLVGIFWTRLGSPTGVAASGTVEEIEEHIRAGKPAMLYFSKAPVVPDSLDQYQYAELKKFKDWAMSQGLVSVFDSVEDFREKFRRDLELNLRDNEHLAAELTPNADEGGGTPRAQRITLSDAATKLLTATARSADGIIMMMRTFDGAYIKAGNDNVIGANLGPRELARWSAGIEELESYGLIEAASYKREVFRLTHAGWEAGARLAQDDATEAQMI
jgi:hypothetical protein